MAIWTIQNISAAEFLCFQLSDSLFYFPSFLTSCCEQKGQQSQLQETPNISPTTQEYLKVTIHVSPLGTTQLSIIIYD